MSKTYRDYSVQDKAAALAWLEANGGNVLKTSKELEVPQQTLRDWRDGKHIDAEINEKRDEKKRELGELFEECCRLYLQRAMDAGAIDDTKGKDAVIAAATAFDKHQLTKGGPTSINKDITTLTEAEKQAKIEEIMERGRARFKLLKPTRTVEFTQ